MILRTILDSLAMEFFASNFFCSMLDLMILYFEFQVALRALHAVWDHRSSISLLGNHIDVLTGRWTAQDSGIGR